MYPFWEVPGFTSALFIALIASFHILPSHLATGAFWFNVFLEQKALKENRPDFLEFIKKYTLLILIFCFVYGSITGVGIWFSATVASPRSLSSLIHNYVWGWATEWVFFVIEIVAIYVYYYTLGKIDAKAHLRIGWIYAWAAWISMVIITGILAFMLTSGNWLQTGGFFDGFFNATYWPQLFARTAMMFGIAGMYAIIAAGRLEKGQTREQVVKLASIWGAIGTIVAVLCSVWFVVKMPEAAKGLGIGGGLPYLKKLLYVAAGGFGIVFLYFLLGISVPKVPGTYSGILMIIVFFAGIFAIEGFREGVRRPYIISGYMYGNQIIASDVPGKGIKAEVASMKENGFLENLYFLPDEAKKQSQAGKLSAGRMIALHQCGNCHSFEKNANVRSIPVLLERISMTSAEDIAMFLDTLDGGYAYMPPFAGTDDDKQAAAAWLASICK